MTTSWQLVMADEHPIGFSSADVVHITLNALVTDF